MNINFDGKLVLVTASTKGIGFAIAENFLKSGAKVVICSRNKKNIKKAELYITRKYNKNNFLILKCDIGNKKEILNLKKKIKNKFNKTVDILINNSGGPPSKKIIDTNYKDWEDAININLFSSIIITKLLLPDMIKKKWGRIINLTSTTAKEPAKLMSLSNVTRSGLVSFGKTLSKELSGTGITVNNILTGGVLTDRLLSLVTSNSKNKKSNLKYLLKKIEKSIPSNYLILPNEFAEIVLFLCSDKSNYINGISINIDGGSGNSIY